ncbi:MAG: adenylate kinase [Tepidiformaceae bacterium]
MNMESGDAAGVGRRVIVVGASCAGKSTLSERLAGMLGVPFVELDALFWKPGWEKTPDDEFLPKVVEATSGDGWVVAGAYHRQTEPTVWPRAETAVWLDFPLRTVTWRILRRSWVRWRRKELLWGTNEEKFWEQLKVWSHDDSLIGYTWRTHGQKRARYTAAMADPAYAHIRFVRLRSQREVDAWLAGVEASLDESRQGHEPLPAGRGAD